MSAFDPVLSDRGRELLARIERLGSAHALREMTDPELDQWIHACQAMLARPARAASAHRRWRQLLSDAHAEHATRTAGTSGLP